MGSFAPVLLTIQLGEANLVWVKVRHDFSTGEKILDFLKGLFLLLAQMKQLVFLCELPQWDTSLNFGMNFAQYAAMPRKLRTPLAVEGAGASLIASIFLGSGAIPLPENTNPKKVREGLLTSHFL